MDPLAPSRSTAAGPRTLPATLLCLVLAASRPGPAAASGLPTESYLLPNGMRVLLQQDRRYPRVMVHVCHHVGSGAEQPGKSGLAHLVEHLMYLGNPSLYLHQIGATGMNGTTQYDRMDFFVMVPSANLAGALAVESARMDDMSARAGNLGGRIDGKYLGDERKVVLNERRQRTETQPFGLAEEHLWHALFPAGHPYHGFVIGKQEDLAAVQPADVREYYPRDAQREGGYSCGRHSLSWQARLKK